MDTLTSTGEPGRTSSGLRSLAIVGSHPDTRENAPFDDPDYEIWLFNEAPQKAWVKRWDADLQIHKEEVYTSLQNWVNKDHWEWLQQDHGPDKRIFMQEVDPRVPNSVKYPLEEILELIPYRYLRSSPSLMLALAIYLGYKRIEIYGSDLSSNTEYRYQAINFLFWVGFAHGRGVDLVMKCWPEEFDQAIYGYEGELQIPHEYYTSTHKNNETTWRISDKGYQKLGNRIDDALLNAEFDKVAELIPIFEDVAINTGEMYGATKECKRYMERTDQISRQEFERRSAQAQIDGEISQKKMDHEGGKVEYVYNVWKLTGKLEAKNQLSSFLDKKTDYAFEVGEHLGKFRENLAYRDEYDRLVGAAGGKRAVYYEGRDTVMKKCAE